MPDWKAIEADFLATGMSYSDLARKWKVSLSTLKKKAMRGEWSRRYEEVVRRSEPGGTAEEPSGTTEEPEGTAEDIIQTAADRRVERLRRMLKTTDEMMDRVIEALGQMEPGNTVALYTLIKSLKELREMQGLHRTELDIEEQRARIAKLRREAAAQDETREISVNIMGMTPEELSEVIG